VQHGIPELSKVVVYRESAAASLHSRAVEKSSSTHSSELILFGVYEARFCSIQLTTVRLVGCARLPLLRVLADLFRSVLP